MLGFNSVALSITYTSWHHMTGKPAVVVNVGDAEVAVLAPSRESKAGDGDDSSYFASEERAIAEETVTPYLQKLFNQ